MNLYELYDYAVDQGIDVDWYTMPFAKSFSIFIPSLDRRAIALDPWKFETVADEFTTLGHEVGHCMTYSFYNRWAACDIKKKHENRADKWEIEQFLPLDALEAPSCLVRVECGVYSRELILGQDSALQVSWGLNPPEMIVSHAKK